MWKLDHELNEWYWEFDEETTRGLLADLEQALSAQSSAARATKEEESNQ